MNSHIKRKTKPLESFFEDALLALGYSELPNHKKQVFANRAAIGGKQYKQQVYVGPTIYQTRRVVDFLLINNEKFPDGLIVECKWQKSAGTVDEKYPYLYYNIIQSKAPTIILLDGGGYKPAAKQWLKGQVHSELNRKLLGVWDMEECQSQIDDGFFG